MSEYTENSNWNVDFTKNPRIQHQGYNFGKRTTKRKTSLGLDYDLGQILDQLCENNGRSINKNFNHYFRLGLRVEGFGV